MLQSSIVFRVLSKTRPRRFFCTWSSRWPRSPIQRARESRIMRSTYSNSKIYWVSGQYRLLYLYGLDMVYRMHQTLNAVVAHSLRVSISRTWAAAVHFQHIRDCLNLHIRRNTVIRELHHQIQEAVLLNSTRRRGQFYDSTKLEVRPRQWFCKPCYYYVLRDVGDKTLRSLVSRVWELFSR